MALTGRLILSLLLTVLTWLLLTPVIMINMHYIRNKYIISYPDHQYFLSVLAV